MSHPTSKPEPANMLTLPREIRQKIFEHAFINARAEDCRLDDIFTDMRHVVNASQNERLAEEFYNVDRPAPHIHDLAHNLSGIHPTIRDDLGFVMDRELTLLVEDMEAPRKEEKESRRVFRWSQMAVDAGTNLCLLRIINAYWRRK